MGAHVDDFAVPRSAPVRTASDGTDTVIGVERLSRRYGSTVAVDDVSFEVHRGEIFGLLGRNGAGKTTTVECLEGLRRADGGRLRVLGLDPATQAGLLRRRIGCQLQESALPHNIKVWEALQWFASFTPRGVDWPELIEQWGLAAKRTAQFGQLSGGQRQRLFIALALVNDPEVVFLDEMTTGLDPAARHVAWDLIRRVRDGGTTVVLVTHFMDEAEQLCDRIAIVDRGRLVDLDTPHALVARHTDHTTLRFATGTPDVSWLHALPQVHTVTRAGQLVTVTGTGSVLVDVAAALVSHGLHPTDVRVEQPSLEDVFLQLTGHGLEE
jgi:ABC-2 type transport system ATP-binding protein